MNALEIRDLTKHYTGFSLNHLNLTLPWGCIMGLVGENGAGKSTTIKLILNTISRDGGTVTILGRDNRENLCQRGDRRGAGRGGHLRLSHRPAGRQDHAGHLPQLGRSGLFRLSDPAGRSRG
ncbi:MAG: ATP-binding cassette domain-containing protein [Oscillospiraceae bacterium]|nr:ATP-binding cassette domain-containing protein [Oscillospiraceae bacterium]